MKGARFWVGLTIVLLPGLLLAPVWRLGGLGAAEDDVLYYYPGRVFFQETVQAGEWPWWNPWTGLGRPFMADPQTACWYPTTWLFAVAPPLVAYGASLWLHYSLALWGGYRLLRGVRNRRPAALFGAVAFAFCGALVAHRAHFTLQHAAAWTPWVFWRLRRYAAERGDAVRLLHAALAIGLQALAGHIQITALTAGGALVYLLATGRADAAGALARWRAGATSARWLLACIAGGGLFAVQLLPTIAYLRECTRHERGYLDFVENSWNPGAAVTFVAPLLLGQRTPNFFADRWWGPSHQVEQLAYVGVLPLLLAGAALVGPWRGDARRRGWIVLAGVALLLALGQFGPVCPVLYWLPGSRLFRCPARALLLVQLAAAALAANSLNTLLAPLTPGQARLRAALLRLTRRPLRGALLTLLALALAIALVALFLPDGLRRAALAALRPWNPALLVPLALLGATLALLRVALVRWERPRWLLAPALLLAVDLGVVGWSVDVPAGVTDARALLTPRDDAWLAPVAASGRRLWVVTQRRADGVPGEYLDPVAKCAANTNILRSAATLSDYGPLQPRAYVQHYSMQPWGESWRAAELLADTRWTRRANVGWILLCEDDWPAPDGATLAERTPVGRLYQCPDAAGPVFVAAAGRPAAVNAARPSPSAIVATIDAAPAPRDPARPAGRGAPVRVVCAEWALPGWRVTVDDAAATLAADESGLLAVDAPGDGAHRVVWRYSPPGLAAGLAVSAVTLCGLVGAAFFGGRWAAARRARGGPHPPRA